MTKYFLNILFILLVLNAGCDKTDMTKFPQRYTRESFISGEVNALTNNKIKLSENELSTFLSKCDGFFWDENNGDNLRDNYKKLIDFEIIIFSNDSATIINLNDTVPCDIIHTNDILYFQSKYVHYSNPPGLYTNFIWSHFSNDPKHLYKPITFSISPLPDLGYVYYPCIYMIKEKNKLIMPMVSYLELINGADIFTGNGIASLNII